VVADAAATRRGPRGRAGSDMAIVSQKGRPKHALPPSTARAPMFFAVPHWGTKPLILHEKH
jgi:hypothetical protein